MKTSAPSAVTPDGRYFVVRGRLWRCTNPILAEDVHKAWVERLMDARRAKGAAMRRGDAVAQEAARRAVDEAKHRLGERGPVWWNDGAPDYNRYLAKNTPYAEWFGTERQKSRDGISEPCLQDTSGSQMRIGMRI